MSNEPPNRIKRPSSGDMPWEEAIQQILEEAGGALHYAQVSERIVAGNLRRNVGATPASTVASYISTSLREDKDKSPYLRVNRGEYTLRRVAEQSEELVNDAATETDQEQETGALRAFGMFWQRDGVFWTGKPQILGRQSAGATTVNFAGQIGVYLLHDRERVIYVGRAADTLFTRLKAHTADRLGGRWDRFSWFGLKNVRDNGELSDGEVPWSQEVVIVTMEALLIESLEPPLNRRRGDSFSGAEYIQAPDPQIEKTRQKAFLEKITKQLEVD